VYVFHTNCMAPVAVSFLLLMQLPNSLPGFAASLTCQSVDEARLGVGGVGRLEEPR
jgi:hypothetical protein